MPWDRCSTALSRCRSWGSRACWPFSCSFRRFFRCRAHVFFTAALVPVLYLFGPAQFHFLSWSQLAIVMAAYIINATTSCGPSPLGGGGMMGEGTMRAETGFIKGAFTFASMAIMAPVAAIYMKFLNLSVFQPSDPTFAKNITVIIEFALVVAGGEYRDDLSEQQNVRV